MNLTTYPRTPRLINHFTLGADPEFTFVDSLGCYTHAELLGLNTLQGFGCDMAGRMAELRAFPSKFALEVVAGIVDTLRWMAIAKPETLEYTWSAASFRGKDGIGGHVHIGRKRAEREKDIAVLDSLTAIMVNSNVFDRVNFDARRKVSRYGQWSDFRPQQHGYEYRTLPTEMANPWLMYFTLVLAKLVLHEGLIASVSNPPNYFHLLEKYKNLDDDAAIALMAVKHYGVPKDTEADFKCAWGVSMYWPVVVPVRPFYPSVIAPTEETCQELFEHFTQGKKMPFRVPEATWTPQELPAKFSPVSVQPHSLGHLPDAGMNLVSKNCSVRVSLVDEPDKLRIQHSFPLSKVRIRKAFSAKFQDVRFQRVNGGTLDIAISREASTSLSTCKFINNVLGSSRLFPICKASRINEVNWEEWDIAAKSPTKAQLIGRQVALVDGTQVAVEKTGLSQRKRRYI